MDVDWFGKKLVSVQGVTGHQFGQILLACWILDEQSTVMMPAEGPGATNYAAAEAASNSQMRITPWEVTPFPSESVWCIRRCGVHIW